MANSKKDFFTDPDRLAEGFLLSEYIWDPNPDKRIKMKWTQQRQKS